MSGFFILIIMTDEEYYNQEIPLEKGIKVTTIKI
jgi:hypothetical protein